MSWRSCVNKGGCLYETVQAIRWFPVLIVIGACSWGYYAYIYELSIVAVDNWPQRILYILGFHILLILFATSYFKTIFTSPSKPPKEFFFEDEALEEIKANQDDERKLQAVLVRYASQRKLPIRVRGFDNGIRFCEKCKCIKPDRAHHCSMCGQCVLKFDHHCPWVNNCVNFSNYKFFLLFLGYGFAFCMWIFFTDLPYFINFWKTEFAGAPIVGGKFHLLFLVFVSAMFALSLSALFFYHLYLTGKNRSTVESFRAPLIDGRYEKNAFNHGIRSNYREVFGCRRLFWFLPVYSSIGTGAEFNVSWDRLSAPAFAGIVENGGNAMYGENGVVRTSQIDETNETGGEDLEMRHFSGNGKNGGEEEEVKTTMSNDSVTASNSKNGH